MSTDTTTSDSARSDVPPAGLGRLVSVVLDCADPHALAGFYARLLGWEVQDGGDGTWVSVADPTRPGVDLCFQGVDDFVPPSWPGIDPPQQFHLDVDVTDLDAGEAAVIALGATKHEHQPGESFRVFLDPQGHPFCLCQG